MKRIAMTGGAGHIATQLRGLLCPDVEHLRLIDISPVEDLADNESFVKADLADADLMKRALADMDGVIHLGGIAQESDIASILRVNALGTYNVYEAARANGVERVVFASSNHATGFYARSETITPPDPCRPDSRYGLSKCFGELVAGFYYDTAGIRTLSIRIGNAETYPNSERSAAIWISARDLAQLIQIGLNHPDIAAAIVYGVSRTDATWWKDDLAWRLGYRPEDNPRDHLRIEKPAEGTIAAYFQGGGFCEGEHDGKLRLRDRDGLVVKSEAAS
ncbi:NAD(P)-dependent oxidoreductase [Sinorhizobium sp. BJ1]|uniref:NAD-dependent epimerase/dehydratase family protein n=1 Tax=Sinorhizobium sp. BJ1 TaxID=2035455 RepID=UPI000BE9EF81|nr:NAD(P)-dependent oxidoreductase [Sinorhizobium sp. BJ1]PDT81238.1 dehydrogenase [Sinorhizobium sp. BJ1]